MYSLDFVAIGVKSFTILANISIHVCYFWGAGGVFVKMSVSYCHKSVLDGRSGENLHHMLKICT